MRYAIISDIHANLEAFQAVADALSKEDIGAYLCLGDIVGYGADPAACIRLLKSLKPVAIIAGNHDWGAVDLLGLEYFNEMAKDALVWTKSVLGKEECDFLRSLQLVYETESLTLVHGTLDHPGRFNYVLNEYDARVTMKLSKTSLCFVGHSHIAETYYSQGSEVIRTADQEIEIEPKRKYVINAGSVGQPRDGVSRAAYCIYDDASRMFATKRVAYDIQTAQQKIIEAGLPQGLAIRLSRGE